MHGHLYGHARPTIALGLYGKQEHVASDSKQAKSSQQSTQEASLHTKIMLRTVKESKNRKTLEESRQYERSRKRTKRFNKLNHISTLPLPFVYCLPFLSVFTPSFCCFISNSFCCLTFSPPPSPFFLSVSVSLAHEQTG